MISGLIALTAAGGTLTFNGGSNGPDCVFKYEKNQSIALDCGLSLKGIDIADDIGDLKRDLMMLSHRVGLVETKVGLNKDAHEANLAHIVTMTSYPTSYPTSNPTPDPTFSPTPTPTANPTLTPTAEPTVQPTLDPTSQPTSSPTAPFGWKAVLKYPNAYQPTRSASGNVLGGGYGFAKLSDSDINSFTSCSGWNYYKLVQEADCRAQCTMMVKTQRSYDDTSRSFGWSGDYYISNDASAGPWGGSFHHSGYSRFETEGVYGNNCNRWFADYSGTPHCYNGASGRCFSDGSSCGHTPRHNVVIYKLQGCSLSGQDPS